MKRVIAMLLVVLTLVTGALAQSLAPVRTFPNGEFSDLQDNWSRPYLVRCYELGLLSGKGSGRLDPGGTVSLAEAITVSARVRDLWTGGTGELSTQGAHWYDGALDYVTANNMLPPGGFSNLESPASRAQLAAILARTLPQDGYAVKNQIQKLPDVSSATPYADDILRLYAAGILTGGDPYGTFSPAATITRAEFSAILCRLVQPETRVSLTLAEKPRSNTVRSTDLCLWLAGVPLYGVTEIDGAYYLPLELLSRRGPLSSSAYWDDSGYSLSLAPSAPPALQGYTLAPPAGKVMGTAVLSPLPVTLNGQEVARGVVYTLGGAYPMIPLSVLAGTAPMKQEGKNITLLPDLAPAVTPAWESDLVGNALPPLLKGSDRDTLRAIHDYIVNTLTYDPLVSAPWGFTEAQAARVEAAQAAAASQYKLQNNLALASGYGICEDYASLFLSMCLRAGIPCAYVRGTGNGEGHAWNKVYVDGQWLYVDCTFDDPVSAKPELRHTNFLVGPDEMAVSHYWSDDDFPMPETYDPAWAQLDPNNITSRDMFRKCLVAQVMQGNTHILLRTTRSGAYGGLACLSAYPLPIWEVRGGYNKALGCYEFFVS